MPIKIVTGVPGSGKSYYSVHQTVKEFFEWDNELDKWVTKKDVTIFTNISNFKLPHINLKQYMEERELSVEDYFNVDYMSQVVEKYGQIVLIIDEAQTFFPNGYKERSVLYFFEYHRHLSIDIYLVTQDLSRISKQVFTLAEYEIKAVPRTLKIANEFRYKFVLNGDTIHNKVLKSDKKIFALYQSFQGEEVKQKINPVRKYILYLVLLILICVASFKMFVGVFFGGPGGKAQAEQVQEATETKTEKLNSEGGKAQGRAAPGPARPAAPEIKREPFVTVYCGAAWVGDYPVKIHLQGEVIDPSDMPYLWMAEADRRRVRVLIPSSRWKQLQMLDERIAKAEQVEREAERVERY